MHSWDRFPSREETLFSSRERAGFPCQYCSAVRGSDTLTYLCASTPQLRPAICRSVRRDGHRDLVLRREAKDRQVARRAPPDQLQEDAGLG